LFVSLANQGRCHIMVEHSKPGECTDNLIRNPAEAIPFCPVCHVSPIVFATRTKDLDICICPNCGTSLSVPHEAWRLRRQNVEGV
jgi:hypothetical protein